MLKAVELAHPVEEAELSLVVDASGTHVGAVLHQKDKAGSRPLGFFSAKLDSAQQKYSAYNRELLVLYSGIRHFQWLLEGPYFLCSYRSQAADVCAQQNFRSLDWPKAAPSVLCGRIHFRYQAHT